MKYSVILAALATVLCVAPVQAQQPFPSGVPSAPAETEADLPEVQPEPEVIATSAPAGQETPSEIERSQHYRLTLDEFLEVVTVVQTLKIKKKVPIVLFGKTYWESILNFDPMVEFGTISASDLDLFFMTDSTDEAYEHITQHLLEHAMKVPEDDFLTL